MAWILENWVWVLFGVGFITMHIFGHGGHSEEEKPVDKDSKQETPKEDSGHKH